jgi:hypothetical protein
VPHSPVRRTRTLARRATARLAKETALVAEVNGRQSTRQGVAPVGTESSSKALVGVRHRTESVWLDAGAFVGLAPIDPGFGLTAGVSYAFRAFAVP